MFVNYTFPFKNKHKKKDFKQGLSCFKIKILCSKLIC